MPTYYKLDDDNLYIRSCIIDGEIKIRRITNPGEATGTWKEFKFVNINNDGLVVFDEVIFGSKLRELEAELKKSKLYVNRQGYCYGLIDSKVIHRVNDIFNWSRYGVVPKITTIWNRCNMNNNAIVIDYEKMEKTFETMKLQLEKKDRELSDKDQELKDCKLQLQKRERELSVLVSLWERQLEASGSSNSSFNF